MRFSAVSLRLNLFHFVILRSLLINSVWQPKNIKTAYSNNRAGKLVSFEIMLKF